MNETKYIDESYSITPMNAPNVKFQYSTDGREPWNEQPNDFTYYMRVSNNNGYTWGEAIRVRGEDGEVPRSVSIESAQGFIIKNVSSITLEAKASGFIPTEYHWYKVNKISSEDYGREISDYSSIEVEEAGIYRLVVVYEYEDKREEYTDVQTVAKISDGVTYTCELRMTGVGESVSVLVYKNGEQISNGLYYVDNYCLVGENEWKEGQRGQVYGSIAAVENANKHLVQIYEDEGYTKLLTSGFISCAGDAATYWITEDCREIVRRKTGELSQKKIIFAAKKGQATTISAFEGWFRIFYKLGDNTNWISGYMSKTTSSTVEYNVPNYQTLTEIKCELYGEDPLLPLDIDTINVINEAKDGYSNITIGLSNDMDSIPMTSDGKVVCKDSIKLKTAVRMFNGNEEVPVKGISWDYLPTGVKAEPVGNEISFSVENDTVFQDDRAVIGITAFCEIDGEDYARETSFIIKGVRFGENAVMYSLNPSVPYVLKNADGTYSEEEVKISFLRRDGETVTEVETLPFEYTYQLELNGSTSWTSKKVELQKLPLCTKFITWRLYYGNDSISMSEWILVDEEKVEIRSVALQIGENLLHGTKLLNQEYTGNYGGLITVQGEKIEDNYNGFTALKGSTKGGLFALLVWNVTGLESNAYYTVSFWAKGTGGKVAVVLEDLNIQKIESKDESPIAVTSDWKFYEYHFKLNANYYQSDVCKLDVVQYGTTPVTIAGIKLEQNPEATSWVPHVDEYEGFSPTVKAERTDNGVELTIINKDGKGESVKITDGENGISLNNAGVWKHGISYNLNDYVYYEGDGNSYASRVDSNKTEPSRSDAWTILAKRGEDSIQYYSHYVYCDNPDNGENYSTKESRAYIGTYVDTQETDITDWRLLQNHLSNNDIKIVWSPIEGFSPVISTVQYDGKTIIKIKNKNGEEEEFSIKDGANGISLTNRGNWDSNSYYSENDYVYYEGTKTSYVCRFPNVNITPTNPNYWSILSAPGDKGKDSIQYYIHYVYCDDPNDGLNYSTDTSREWVGIYTDTNYNDEKSFENLPINIVWSKVEGDSGYTISVANENFDILVDLQNIPIKEEEIRCPVSLFKGEESYQLVRNNEYIANKYKKAINFIEKLFDEGVAVTFDEGSQELVFHILNNKPIYDISARFNFRIYLTENETVTKSISINIKQQAESASLLDIGNESFNYPADSNGVIKFTDVDEYVNEAPINFYYGGTEVGIDGWNINCDDNNVEVNVIPDNEKPNSETEQFYKLQIKLVKSRFYSWRNNTCYIDLSISAGKYGVRNKQIKLIANVAGIDGVTSNQMLRGTKLIRTIETYTEGLSSVSQDRREVAIWAYKQRIPTVNQRGSQTAHSTQKFTDFVEISSTDVPNEVIPSSVIIRGGIASEIAGITASPDAYIHTIFQPVKLSRDKTYTLSFWVKANEIKQYKVGYGNVFRGLSTSDDSTDHTENYNPSYFEYRTLSVPNSNWTHESITFNVTNNQFLYDKNGNVLYNNQTGYCSFVFSCKPNSTNSYVGFAGFKLEAGEESTGWAEYYDDMFASQYDLLPSVKNIKLQPNGTLSPESVSCRLVEGNGENKYIYTSGTKLPPGLSMKYKIGSSSWIYSLDTSVSLSSKISDLKTAGNVTFQLLSNGTVIDSEEIPLLEEHNYNVEISTPSNIEIKLYEDGLLYTKNTTCEIFYKTEYKGAWISAGSKTSTTGQFSLSYTDALSENQRYGWQINFSTGGKLFYSYYMPGNGADGNPGQGVKDYKYVYAFTTSKSSKPSTPVVADIKNTTPTQAKVWSTKRPDYNADYHYWMCYWAIMDNGTNNFGEIFDDVEYNSLGGTISKTQKVYFRTKELKVPTINEWITSSSTKVNEDWTTSKLNPTDDYPYVYSCTQYRNYNNAYSDDNHTPVAINTETVFDPDNGYLRINLIEAGKLLSKQIEIEPGKAAGGATGYIQTKNFSDEDTSGFRLKADGSAIFNNIKIQNGIKQGEMFYMLCDIVFIRDASGVVYTPHSVGYVPFVYPTPDKKNLIVEFTSDISAMGIPYCIGNVFQNSGSPLYPCLIPLGNKQYRLEFYTMNLGATELPASGSIVILVAKGWY